MLSLYVNSIACQQQVVTVRLNSCCVPETMRGAVGSCFSLSSSPGCRLKHVPVDITAHRLIHLRLFSIVSIWFECHHMNEFLQNEFQIGKTVICIHTEITEVLSVAENDSGRAPLRQTGQT